MIGIRDPIILLYIFVLMSVPDGSIDIVTYGEIGVLVDLLSVKANFFKRYLMYFV